MGTDKTGAAMLLDISNNYREPPTRPHPHPSHFPPQSRDCSFSVSCESVRLGESVTLVTSIANNGALQRTVDGRVVCHVVDYTGHVMRRFASMTFTGVVAPGQSEYITVCVLIIITVCVLIIITSVCAYITSVCAYNYY